MAKRIIGGIIIVLISFPFLILGGYYNAIFCSILGILALKEIEDLKKELIPKSLYIINLLVIFLGILFSYIRQNNFYFDYRWLSILILYLFIPNIIYKDKYSSSTSFYLLANMVFLGTFFSSLIMIREINGWLLIYLLSVSVFTDCFALIVGKMLGKHKCAPTISPGKTWEGSIGGIVFGVVISSFIYLGKIGTKNIFTLFILTFVLSLIGEIGDLIFSKIKRENNIKDFSNLIIGHGGLLDRIDSLIFIVLTYVLLRGIF